MASDMEPDSTMKCLLCQNFLSDPTTIPCGHNFCMKCITRCWDMEIYSGIYTCPRCKRTLTVRPTLSRNVALANMVQQVIDLRQRVPGAGGDEVRNKRPIAVTKDKLRKKTKEWEEDLEKLRAKMLSLEKSAEAASQVSEGIYTKLLNTIERKREEHRQHMTEKKKALMSQAEAEEKWLICQISNLGKRDTELNSLGTPNWDKSKHSQIYENINMILQQEKQPSEFIRDYNFLTIVDTDLSDLRVCVEALWNETSQNTQKKAPVIKPRLKVPDVNKKINVIRPLTNQEVIPLKEIITEGPHISKDNEPPAHVIVKPIIRRSQSLALGTVRPKDKRLVEVKPTSLMTKEDLLQNACSLTLDQETANPFLLLSENNNKVTGSKARQRRQSLTKAFDHWKQVLCVERLVGGQCYWEVDWSGKGVFIGVALEGLCKRGKGMECGLGRNASSWSLHCTNDRYTAWHNNIEHEIAINVASPRIGVFLDQLEGTLTFYSVAGEVTAIHMFTAQNLNNLLYPCFGIEQESSVKLVQLNRNFTFSI